MMLQLVRRYAVAAAFALAFCAATVTAGNKLATIENRQANQTKAIECLMDSRCFLLVHAHAHAHQQPTATTPTRTLI
jgi:hypothetical protein